jgi:hypothetical protein
MPMTNFGTNDPLAVNLWSKSVDVEARKHTDIFPLTGDDANSVIHRKPKTSTPQGERFSAPQAAIRADLIADDSCSALGMTVRGFAPVLALCRLLVEAGHHPATPLEAWRGDVPCIRIRSIGAAAALRIGTHGVGFETLSECTAASPVRENALRFRPPEGQARTDQRGADVQSNAYQKIPDHPALCARG